MPALNFLLRRTGVVAVPLVNRKGRVVAGIREDHAKKFALGRAHREHGHVVIHRAKQFAGRPQGGHVVLGIFPPVHGKIRGIDAPAQCRRHQVRQGRLRGLHHPRFQLLPIGGETLPVLVVEHAQAIGKPLHEGRAMRVGNIHHH